MMVVSRAKDLEVRLERTESQLHLYQRISRYLAKAQPLTDALKAIVKLVADFMRADSCLLYLISQDELILCAASGSGPAIGDVRLRLNEGLTGWVARERRLLAISREAYRDPRFKYFRDLPEDTFEAFLSAPVLVAGRVVGVINVQHRQARVHSGEELELIAAVGEQIGALVALAILEAQVFDRTGFADLVLVGREVR